MSEFENEKKKKKEMKDFEGFRELQKKEESRFIIQHKEKKGLKGLRKAAEGFKKSPAKADKSKTDAPDRLSQRIDAYVEAVEKLGSDNPGQLSDEELSEVLSIIRDFHVSLSDTDESGKMEYDHIFEEVPNSNKIDAMILMYEMNEVMKQLYDPEMFSYSEKMLEELETDEKNDNDISTEKASGESKEKKNGISPKKKGNSKDKPDDIKIVRPPKGEFIIREKKIELKSRAARLAGIIEKTKSEGDYAPDIAEKLAANAMGIVAEYAALNVIKKRMDLHKFDVISDNDLKVAKRNAMTDKTFAGIFKDDDHLDNSFSIMKDMQTMKSGDFMKKLKEKLKPVVKKKKIGS